MSKSDVAVSKVKTTNHTTSFSEHIQNAISAVAHEAQELSIVLFRIGERDTETADRDSSFLVDSEIQSHMRATDSVGWLDQDHLAFVLPETGSDGAAELLHRLVASTMLAQAAEDYWVISYPRCSCQADAVVDYERFRR